MSFSLSDKAPETVVFCFNNGNLGVCQGGHQVPALQEPWILDVVRRLESKGVDPTKCEFNLPGGNKARVFKTDDGGWNWRFD